jgi:hypothetical protein
VEALFFVMDKSGAMFRKKRAPRTPKKANSLTQRQTVTEVAETVPRSAVDVLAVTAKDQAAKFVAVQAVSLEEVANQVDDATGAFAMAQSLGAELAAEAAKEERRVRASSSITSPNSSLVEGGAHGMGDTHGMAGQVQRMAHGHSSAERVALEGQLAAAEASLQDSIIRRDFEEAARIQRHIDECKDRITALLLQGGEGGAEDERIEAAFEAGRSPLKKPLMNAEGEESGGARGEADEMEVGEMEEEEEAALVAMVTKEMAKQVAKEVVEEEVEELVDEAVEAASQDNGIDEDVLALVNDAPACLNIAFNLYSRLSPPSALSPSSIEDDPAAGTGAGSSEDEEGDVLLLLSLDRDPGPSAGFSICAWFDFCCRCLRGTTAGAGGGVSFSDLVRVFRSASSSGLRGRSRSPRSSSTGNDSPNTSSPDTLTFVQFKIALRYLAVLTSSEGGGRGKGDKETGNQSEQQQKEEDLESWFCGFAAAGEMESSSGSTTHGHQSSLALARARARARLVEILSELARRMPVVSVHAQSLLQRPLPSPSFYSTAVMSVVRRHELALDHHFHMASVLSTIAPPPSSSSLTASRGAEGASADGSSGTAESGGNNGSNNRSTMAAQSLTASMSSSISGAISGAEETGVGYAALITLLRGARLLRPLAGEELIVDRCFKCACRPYRWTKALSPGGRGSTWKTPTKTKMHSMRAKRDVSEKTNAEGVESAGGVGSAEVGGAAVDDVAGKSRWERSLEQAHLNEVRLGRAEFAECLLRCAVLLPIVGTMVDRPSSPSRSSSSARSFTSSSIHASSASSALDRSYAERWNEEGDGDDEDGGGSASSANSTVMTCRRVEALLKALSHQTDYKQKHGTHASSVRAKPSPSKAGRGGGGGSGGGDGSGGGGGGRAHSGLGAGAYRSSDPVVSVAANEALSRRAASRALAPAGSAPAGSKSPATVAAADSTAASVVFDCYQDTLMRIFQAHTIRRATDTEHTRGLLQNSNAANAVAAVAAAAVGVGFGLEPEGLEYAMELEGFLRFLGTFKVFSEGWIEERVLLRIFRSCAMQQDGADGATGQDAGEKERLLQLGYNDFVQCLGAIATRMFSGAAFEAEYPTARDKVSLLLFKMDESDPGVFEGIGSMLALRHCAPL